MIFSYRIRRLLPTNFGKLRHKTVGVVSSAAPKPSPTFSIPTRALFFHLPQHHAQELRFIRLLRDTHSHPFRSTKSRSTHQPSRSGQTNLCGGSFSYLHPRTDTNLSSPLHQPSQAFTFPKLSNTIGRTITYHHCSTCGIQSQYELSRSHRTSSRKESALR